MKKIPAPLTQEQLRDFIQNTKEASIIVPKHSEMPSADKVSKADAKAGLVHASHVDIKGIYYFQDEIGVDGTGKEHKFPGGMRIDIDWAVPGFGFGSLSIRRDNDGTLKIDSETLGKDFVKAILCDLVDKAEVK